jgi:hypothetical protein
MRRVVLVGVLMAGTMSAVGPAASVAAAEPQIAAAAEPQISVNAADNPGNGFAQVDREAMSAQYYRLIGVGSQAPDAFGGAYFSEEDGVLAVRYVAGPAGQALVTRLSALEPQAKDVPVRFEATGHSLARMSAIAARMDSSKEWAGAHAGQVLRVWLDGWRYQIRVAVWGNAEEVAAAFISTTGITPRMSVTTEDWELL